MSLNKKELEDAVALMTKKLTLPHMRIKVTPKYDECETECVTEEPDWNWSEYHYEECPDPEYFWFNVYPDSSSEYCRVIRGDFWGPFRSKKAADESATYDRIECIKCLRVEL